MVLVAVLTLVVAVKEVEVSVMRTSTVEVADTV
jgi:hypothetical protein